jgi:hypothetical protein
MTNDKIVLSCGCEIGFSDIYTSLIFLKDCPKHNISLKQQIDYYFTQCENQSKAQKVKDNILQILHRWLTQKRQQIPHHKEGNTLWQDVYDELLEGLQK